MSKSFLIGSSNKSLDLLHTAYVPTYSNNFKCINSFNFMKGRYYNSHFTDGKTEAQKVKGLTRGYSENNWQWWSLPPSQECWTPVLPLLLILKIEGMCGFLYFLNQKLAFWIIIGQFKNMTACRDPHGCQLQLDYNHIFGWFYHSIWISVHVTGKTEVVTFLKGEHGL